MNVRTATNKSLLVLAAAGVLGGSVFAQQFQPNEIAFNLNDPSKLVVLPGGSFLTVQAGSTVNHGTLTFFDNRGDYTWILLGLPSVRRLAWSAVASGPDGLAVLGNTLYIATGQVMPNGAPPASPTDASILRVSFSRNLADTPGPFVLQPNDYNTLLNGGTVSLTQGANNTATVSLMVRSLNGPSDLNVDASTGRLYIVSRADHTVSWVPLQ